jgi:transposase
LAVISFSRRTAVRAVASRYDKTAVNYLSMVEVACTWLWLS